MNKFLTAITLLFILAGFHSEEAQAEVFLIESYPVVFSGGDVDITSMGEMLSTAYGPEEVGTHQIKFNNPQGFNAVKLLTPELNRIVPDEIQIRRLAVRVATLPPNEFPDRYRRFDRDFNASHEENAFIYWAGFISVFIKLDVKNDELFIQETEKRSTRFKVTQEFVAPLDLESQQVYTIILTKHTKLASSDRLVVLKENVPIYGEGEERIEIFNKTFREMGMQINSRQNVGNGASIYLGADQSKAVFWSPTQRVWRLTTSKSQGTAETNEDIRPTEIPVPRNPGPFKPLPVPRQRNR